MHIDKEYTVAVPPFQIKRLLQLKLCMTQAESLCMTQAESVSDIRGFKLSQELQSICSPRIRLVNEDMLCTCGRTSIHHLID